MENETTTTIEERAAIQTAAKGWAIDPWMVMKGSRIVADLPGVGPRTYEVANALSGANDRRIILRTDVPGKFVTVSAFLDETPDPEIGKDPTFPFTVVKGFADLPEQETKPARKQRTKKAKPESWAEAQPVPVPVPVQVPVPVPVPIPDPDDKDPTGAGLPPDDGDEEQLEIPETLPTLEEARDIVARLRDEHERELEAVDRARGPFEKAAKKFKAAKKRADTSWDALTEAKQKLGIVEGIRGRG